MKALLHARKRVDQNLNETPCLEKDRQFYIGQTLRLGRVRSVPKPINFSRPKTTCYQCDTFVPNQCVSDLNGKTNRDITKPMFDEVQLRHY